MDVVPSIRELRERVRQAREAGHLIGYVPTMGSLHDGHLTLMRQARTECGFVVAGIFVNPIQFGPNEDFERYPRDLARDAELLRTVPVDVLFAPSAAEMYPRAVQTWVENPVLGQYLQGALRPGHFRGVATVVTKLFNIVQPHRAYFGEKDYQQLALVRRLVDDLSFPIEIVAVRTIREDDGVALSSRNAYLTPAERGAARRVPEALAFARTLVQTGSLDAPTLTAQLRRFVAAEPLARPEVVAVCDPETFEELSGALPARVLVALFVRFGNTQLLDHAVLDVPR